VPVVGGRPLPGAPKGLIVYEMELSQIEKATTPPPPVPTDVAAPPAAAKKSPKGVSYKVLKPGKGGPKPTAADTVKVHYTGWTTDGRKFDSSVDRGQPASFPLNRVIKGWTEGVGLMREGEKFEFVIPAALGYGDRWVGGDELPPNSTLLFTVELLEVKSAG